MAGERSAAISRTRRPQQMQAGQDSDVPRSNSGAPTWSSPVLDGLPTRTPAAPNWRRKIPSPVRATERQASKFGAVPCKWVWAWPRARQRQMADVR